MSESEEHDAIPEDQAYWSIVERMLDGFYRCTLAGEFVRVSPKAVRTIGYDSDEDLIGKVTMADLWVYPSERDLLVAELREHGEVRGFEATLETRDGGRVRVEMTVAAWRGPDGELLGSDGVVRDVTASSRSEQQFRSLIQNSPGAIFRFVGGERRRYTFMSEAIEEITGYPPEHFTDKEFPIADMVHPDDVAIGAALRAVDASSGEHFAFECRIIRPDSEVRWIKISGGGAADRVSDDPVVDGVILDVTDVHEATAAVERSEATFRNLFESMAEGYWVTDSAGCIELCNPASARILGYPDQASLMGVDTLEIMVQPAQREALLSKLATDRFVEGSDIDVRRYDGETITLNFSTRLTEGTDDPQSQSTFRDVTGQKQVEEEIMQARHAAEQANRAKSTFLANMSHELRTPLNAIIGYSEMMMEEAEDLAEDVFSEDLKKVHGAGTHLLALINDVLDLSKIEAGRTELFGEDFTAEELVNSVSATIEPLVANNGNAFVLEAIHGDVALHQDLTKLRQSLLNLLSNAAKFTNNGTVTLSSRVVEEGGERLLELAVADTGIGVPLEKHESLFEEFSQADASTTRNFGGTGLGLAISRRFCRMMGGEITVDSTPGEGSTFTIRVPLVLSESRVQELAGQQEPLSQLSQPAPPLPKEPGRTVLVIDDDPEACEIIAHHLGRSGFETATASGGREGLELARTIQPCAITLDVMMPGMDGWSVLAALREDPALAGIPVVMISMVDDKSTGYTLGATSYLTKPVDRDELLAVLATYCGSTGSVLVVDDDASTRAMLSRVLGRAGLAVEEAANGEEGLAAVARSKPDAILLDLMMPVMDGFDFLLELRGELAFHEIPVVVVTAKDLSDEEREFLSGRVATVVEKGAYTREQLLEIVRSAVAAAGQRA